MVVAVAIHVTIFVYATKEELSQDVTSLLDNLQVDRNNCNINQVQNFTGIRMSTQVITRYIYADIADIRVA